MARDVELSSKRTLINQTNNRPLTLSAAIPLTMMKLDLGSRLSPNAQNPAPKQAQAEKHKPPCLATYASQEKRAARPRG
jgi:hypothetical protein